MHRSTSLSQWPNVVPSNEPDAIAAAESVLTAGGLIAMPTDTVYGFAASVDRPMAIHRLFTLKRRSLSKAIPILLSDSQMADLVAKELTAEVSRFAERFWPGALTIVVEARDGLPTDLTSINREGKKTVALRVPDHAVARSIIAVAGGALAVTSANRSGAPPALQAMDIERSGSAAPDLIVDGGRVPGGVPSTIIAISDSRVEILRIGAITADEIAKTWALRARHRVTMRPGAV